MKHPLLLPFRTWILKLIHVVGCRKNGHQFPGSEEFVAVLGTPIFLAGSTQVNQFTVLNDLMCATNQVLSGGKLVKNIGNHNIRQSTNAYKAAHIIF